MSTGAGSAHAHTAVSTVTPFSAAFAPAKASASAARSVASTRAPRSAAASDGSPSPHAQLQHGRARQSRADTAWASSTPLSHTSAQYGG